MPVRKKNSVGEWLQTKGLIQLFSLMVAFVAWVIVNSGQIAHLKHSLKIQYVQMPKELVFQKTPLKEVKVELAGSVHQLRSIRDEDLVYPIDLSQAKPGPNRVEIELEGLRLPLDVEASHLNPRSYTIFLEEIFSKSLPIQVTTAGRPQEGFQVGAIKVSPSSILVSGPKSIITKLSEIPINISVEHRDMTFSESITPKLNFPDAEPPDPVYVEVEVLTQRHRLDFPAVPVSIGVEKARGRVSPQTAKVVLEGAGSDLRTLRTSLEVFVPIEGLKRGRYRIRGLIRGLDESKFKVVSIEPDSFLVEIFAEGGGK